MRTCIITGAGTGIGRATSVALANSKTIKNYVLISLGMEDLLETKRIIQECAADKEIVVYDQDLTKYDEMQKIVDDTYKRFGSIDALLNIAGYAKRCEFFDISIEMFKLTFEVNIIAMFALTQAVARYMKETGGVIINVASTSGSTPRPTWLPYAASKSAVIGFSRTLTHELKDYGIKVFNVSPGRCATAMRREVKPNEDQSTIMPPEEIADMMAFFVENMDCNIDGQDIVIRRLSDY